MLNLNQIIWIVCLGGQRKHSKYFGRLATFIGLRVSSFLAILRSPTKPFFSVYRRYKHRLGFLKGLVSSLPVLEAFVHARFADHYPSSRYYLQAHLTPKDFFAALNTAQEDYILLRWWEDIDEWNPSEDFDIAVVEPDAQVWSALVQKTPALYKVDIYTNSGNLDGELTTPYLTQPLLLDAIASRELYANLVYVPSSQYFCLCLIYHMLFHKGRLSGLQFPITGEVQSDQRYWLGLERHCAALNLELTRRAESFATALKAYAYFPSGDLLEKYIEKRPELDFLSERTADNIFDDFLLMFIRERYDSDQTVACVVKELEENEFTVLCVNSISTSNIGLVSSRVRGGNWSRGGFEVSAGNPSRWVLALDRQRDLPGEQKLTRKQLVKALVRDRIQSKNWWRRIGNPVHSTDFGYETEEYLRLLMPEDVYQDYYYLASALEQHKAPKIGRFCVSWAEQASASYVKFYGAQHQKAYLRELELGKRFARRGYALTPKSATHRVVKYPLCRPLTGNEVGLQDQWAQFFKFLKEKKLVFVDIAMEQFLIADNGNLVCTDFKMWLEEKDARKWSYWFKTGLIPFSFKRMKYVPSGYGWKLSYKKQFLNLVAADIEV